MPALWAFSKDPGPPAAVLVRASGESCCPECTKRLSDPGRITGGFAPKCLRRVVPTAATLQVTDKFQESLTFFFTCWCLCRCLPPNSTEKNKVLPSCDSCVPCAISHCLALRSSGSRRRTRRRRVSGRRRETALRERVSRPHTQTPRTTDPIDRGGRDTIYVGVH